MLCFNMLVLLEAGILSQIPKRRELFAPKD